MSAERMLRRKQITRNLNITRQRQTELNIKVKQEARLAVGGSVRLLQAMPRLSVVSTGEAKRMAAMLPSPRLDWHLSGSFKA